QIYIQEEVCEEFAREKVSGVEHCRSHRETESGYARHRCPAAREDKMIGQEMNGRAQKLLRAARRKRGTVQSAGVLVSCSHVVSSQTGDLGISFRDTVGDRGCFVCQVPSGCLARTPAGSRPRPSPGLRRLLEGRLAADVGFKDVDA